MSLFSWLARPFVKAAIKDYAPVIGVVLVAIFMLGYLMRGCVAESSTIVKGGTMDNFIMVWGTVSVIVVYLTQVIGRKLPGDIPVLNFAVSLVLNGVAVYATTFFLGIPWDISVFWPYIAGMQVGSQFVHAGMKTGVKAGFNVPLMEPKGNHETP